MGLAGFFHFEDFAALVLPALAAYTVGQLALVAVRALRGADWSKEVMAAALGRALFGVAAFRIRHCGFLSSGPRQHAARSGLMVRRSCSSWI